MTGDSFLPKEGADYAVFFPLWHKEEYFTRTWAPTRSPRKNKVASFPSRFPSRQTQRHTSAHMVLPQGDFFQLLQTNTPVVTRLPFGFTTKRQCWCKTGHWDLPGTCLVKPCNLPITTAAQKPPPPIHTYFDQ